MAHTFFAGRAGLFGYAFLNRLGSDHLDRLEPFEFKTGSDGRMMLTGHVERSP